MAVAEAVLAELEALGLEGSALGASALTLAASLDGSTSGSATAMCARELRETLDRLRALAAERPADDLVDDLARKRDRRRAKAS